ncbi:hypothetical protein BCR34DRAFT_360696 [Clohesyomyces aquaticus]|uniref:Uncharacterized protein n=1 Tax=Clohesyomyces aquaticus TaxID=1231657 RepID=A0A1Y2A6N9_9PLEO|nr:hypothetical protein BCR34DRAFT_360696 [Clohesyomyces aquaticus]
MYPNLRNNGLGVVFREHHDLGLEGWRSSKGLRRKLIVCFPEGFIDGPIRRLVSEVAAGGRRGWDRRAKSSTWSMPYPRTDLHNPQRRVHNLALFGIAFWTIFQLGLKQVEGVGLVLHRETIRSRNYRQVFGMHGMLLGPQIRHQKISHWLPAQSFKGRAEACLVPLDVTSEMQFDAHNFAMTDPKALGRIWRTAIASSWQSLWPVPCPATPRTHLKRILGIHRSWRLVGAGSRVGYAHRRPRLDMAVDMHPAYVTCLMPVRAGTVLVDPLFCTHHALLHGCRNISSLPWFGGLALRRPEYVR